jgi:hypothetical protein
MGSGAGILSAELADGSLDSNELPARLLSANVPAAALTTMATRMAVLTLVICVTQSHKKWASQKTVGLESLSDRPTKPGCAISGQNIRYDPIV